MKALSSKDGKINCSLGSNHLGLFGCKELHDIRIRPVDLDS